MPKTKFSTKLFKIIKVSNLSPKTNRQRLARLSFLLIFTLCFLFALSSCQCNQTIETVKMEYITNNITNETQYIAITNDAATELLARGNVYVRTNHQFFSNLYQQRLLITNFDFDPFVIRDISGYALGSNRTGDFYALEKDSQGNITSSNLALSDVMLPPISVTNFLATNDQCVMITQFVTVANGNITDTIGSYTFAVDENTLYLPSSWGSTNTNVALYRLSDYGFDRWMSTNVNYFTNVKANLSCVTVDASNIYVLNNELKSIVASELMVFAKSNYTLINRKVITPRATSIQQWGEFLFLGSRVRDYISDLNKQGFHSYYKGSLASKGGSGFYFNSVVSPAYIKQVYAIAMNNSNGFFVLNSGNGTSSIAYGSQVGYNIPGYDTGLSFGNLTLNWRHSSLTPLFPPPNYLYEGVNITTDEQGYVYLLGLYRNDIQIFYHDHEQHHMTYRHKFGSRIAGVSNTNGSGRPFAPALWLNGTQHSLRSAFAKGNRFYILSIQNGDFYINVLDKAVLHYSMTNTSTTDRRINHENWWGGHYPE